MRSARSRMVSITADSTASFTRTTGATPSRVTVSVPCTVPRDSNSAALARTGVSTASQPGGSRSRSSRPLALTDFSSQAQA